MQRLNEITAWLPDQQANVDELKQILKKEFERLSKNGRLSEEYIDSTVESYSVTEEQDSSEERHYTVEDVKRVIIFNEELEVQEVVPSYVCYNKEIYNLEKSKMEAELAAVLARRKFTPDQFKEFAKRAKERIYKSYAEEGLSVGVIAAQAVGQQRSQDALNSFHHAGVGSARAMITSGGAVFDEVIRNAKLKTAKNPLIYTYLRNATLEEALDVRDELEHITLRTLAVNDAIRYRLLPPSEQSDKVLKMYDIIYNENMYDEFRGSWVLRMYYSKPRLASRELTPDEICRATNAEYKYYAFAIKGSFSAAYIDFYISKSCLNMKHKIKLNKNLSEAKQIKRVARDFLRLKIETTTIRGIDGIDIVAPVDSNLNAYIAHVDKNTVVFDESSMKASGVTEDHIVNFVSMHIGAKLLRPAKVSVCGTCVTILEERDYTKSEIQHAMHSAENMLGSDFLEEDGSLSESVATFLGISQAHVSAAAKPLEEMFVAKKVRDSAESWSVVARGSKFEEVLYKIEDRINVNAIGASLPRMVEKKFGIDAAQAHIYNTLTKHTGSINPDHLLLTSDLMTQTGTITSIARGGMADRHGGPMKLAAFEETSLNLSRAAAYGTYDSCSSNMSRTMIGAPLNIGTVARNKTKYNKYFDNYIKPYLQTGTQRV